MRWLLDEMMPYAAARILNERGHDAVSVAGTELKSAVDEVVYATAVEQGRIVVTEYEGDFARILRRALEVGGGVVPVVIVRRVQFGRGGALPHKLADALHLWSVENPEPFLGTHYLHPREE